MTVDHPAVRRVVGRSDAGGTAMAAVAVRHKQTTMSPFPFPEVVPGRCGRRSWKPGLLVSHYWTGAFARRFGLTAPVEKRRSRRLPVASPRAVLVWKTH